MVLDYRDYVEMAGQDDGDGVYASAPSIHDTERSIARFIAPDERPPNPFRVQYRTFDNAAMRMQQFLASRAEIFGQWWSYKNCPYCATELISRQLRPLSARVDDARVQQCPGCGWWDLREAIRDLPDDHDFYALIAHRRGLVREFDVAGIDVPMAALRTYILAHPEALHQIHPQKLEHLVASVFRDHLDCEVQHVGGPSDGGVDLVFVQSDRRYVVQVKRRSSPVATEPVSNVREFVGAMVLKGEVRGLFVSTARRYSGEAQDAARTAERRGMESLELIDASRLIDICRLAEHKNPKPWETLLLTDDTIEKHITRGEDTFLASALGDPAWSIAPDT